MEGVGNSNSANQLAGAMIDISARLATMDVAIPFEQWGLVKVTCTSLQDRARDLLLRLRAQSIPRQRDFAPGFCSALNRMLQHSAHELCLCPRKSMCQ